MFVCKVLSAGYILQERQLILFILTIYSLVVNIKIKSELLLMGLAIFFASN